MVEKSTPCRVLVVDDESLMRWWVSETLTALGYSVVEAPDGHGALRALANISMPVDVILLDYRLPDSDDLTLLATIRRVAPDSPVIMMTIYATSAVTDGALALGAHRVMHKPFDMREMVAAIQDAHQAYRH